MVVDLEPQGNYTIPLSEGSKALSLLGFFSGSFKLG